MRMMAHLSTVLMLLAGILLLGCSEKGQPQPSRPSPEASLQLYQATARQEGYEAAAGAFAYADDEQRRTVRALLRVNGLYAELQREMDKQFGGSHTYSGVALQGCVGARRLMEEDAGGLRFSVEGDLATATGLGGSKAPVVMVWSTDRWLIDPVTLVGAKAPAAKSFEAMSATLEEHLAAVRARNYPTREEADAALKAANAKRRAAP